MNSFEIDKDFSRGSLHSLRNSAIGVSRTSIFGSLDEIDFAMENINKQMGTGIQSLWYRISFWALQVLIAFFKLIGLATFTYRVIDQKKKNLRIFCKFQYSKLGVAYNIALVGLILYVNWWMCVDISRYGIGTYEIIVIGRIVFGNISIIVILLLYCFGEKSLVQIGNRLTQIENELDNLYLRYHIQRRERVFCVLTIAYIFYGGVTLFLQFFEPLVFHISLTLWLTDFSVIYLGWFIIQYFLLVSVIKASFADVNHAIDYLAEANESNTQLYFCQIRQNNSVVAKFLKLRDVHAYLCGVSENVSNFYSLAMLFALIHMFCTLVRKCYHFSMPLLGEDYRYGLLGEAWTYKMLSKWLVDKASWCITVACPIFLLTNGVTKLSNEITKTGNSIGNLMSCIIDKETRFELQQISLQLLHRNVSFTVGGFFTLDNNLSQSITSATIMYLVICIQYDMQLSSESCNCMLEDTSEMVK